MHCRKSSASGSYIQVLGVQIKNGKNFWFTVLPLIDISKDQKDQKSKDLKVLKNI